MTSYKKIFFLFLVFLPHFIFAADNCTDPDKYTVDRRCYVTDEQKKETPYNAVVMVDEKNGLNCTGVIVKKDDRLYLYTAKHCVDVTEKYIPDETLNIILQDGAELTVKKYKVGDYDVKQDSRQSEDWAIYSIDAENIPYTTISDLARTIVPVYFVDAFEVGYGTLKVMSDKEIDDFKSNYIEYLKNEKGIDISIDNKYVRVLNRIGADGLNTKNKHVKEYIKSLDSNIRTDLFNDGKNLKVSRCHYATNGIELGCQGWSGDSGGGIFNKNGFLMGIITRGKLFIGGVFHAKSEGNVNLLENIADKL